MQKIFSTTSLIRVVAAAAMLLGLSAYTAPNHQFHVDMGATAASFTVAKEMATDTSTFVLFDFTPSVTTHGAAGERFVLWHKVTDLIADTDGFAQSLAEGILADRYPQGHFAIATKVKSRAADGRAYYIFTASGLYKGVPAQWTGVVQIFPAQGAAIAADVHSIKGQETRDALGITDAEIVTWGTSLKPGE